MKKYLFLTVLIVILSFVLQGHNVSAQTPQTSSGTNFSCSRVSVGPLTFNWSCNTVFPTTPTGCTVSGSQTVCNNVNSILPLAYCRGGGTGVDKDLVECGPQQQTTDQAIASNLKSQAQSGKISCQIDTTYPGGTQYACLPANLTIAGECNPSRYGTYSICNQPPAGCNFSGLPLPGQAEVVSCPLPTNTSSNQTQTTNSSNNSNNCGANGNKLGYCLLEPLPGLQNAVGVDFPHFLAAVFRLLITAGALFAVILLVIGGIGYIISGSGVEIGEAKRRIWAALYGFIILVGAWLLLNTVNPTLLNFNLNSIGGVNDPNADTNNTSGSSNTAIQNAAAQQQQINATCAAQGGHLDHATNGSVICD